MALANDEDIDWKGYRQYQYSYIPLTGPYQVQKKPIANTITLVNQGTTIVYVDDMLRILPNQSFTFDGYPGEICIHNFSISFKGVGQNLCIMVCKNYSK